MNAVEKIRNRIAHISAISPGHRLTLEAIADLLDEQEKQIATMKGAGRAQGVENWQDVRPWWEKNKAKMHISTGTAENMRHILWEMYK